MKSKILETRLKNSRQLRYYYRNKKRINKDSKTKYNALKTLMVSYKNYKCEDCNEYHNIRSLEFHHRTNNKESSVSDMMKTFCKIKEINKEHIDSLKKEVDKCSLLCRNCHAKFHELESNNIIHYIDMIEMAKEFCKEFNISFNEEEFSKNYKNLKINGE